MQIRPTSPNDPSAILLLAALSEALAAITGSSGQASFQPSDVETAGALFVVAFDEDNRPAGCGAYRRLSDGVAEIKRMYAAPGSKGIGATILSFLEDAASKDGYREVWLETRLVNERAVRFYERHLYERVASYGKYVDRPEAVCFGKTLRAL